MPEQRSYIAIDLKSFYASVECVERGLDPLKTHLVVADESRSEKTICLAVTPPLKAMGVPGRPRLFEALERAACINAQRRMQAPGRTFAGSTWDDTELRTRPELKLDFIIAPPRMALYMAYSTRIYQIYLRHIAPEDIHVYSIDEVFIDATPYLKTIRMTARQFASQLVKEITEETGITATAGIGSNLYLCKIAMDMLAKRAQPDENGVRIAELDEISYREQLWEHRPLTDFWRVGGGYARKLEKNGLMTMGDIARCSLAPPHTLYSEKLLYKLFGVNAELLIDHAWGVESCTMADIKAYRPESHSLSSGQVLHCPYAHDKARLIVREMADLLTLDLVDKGLMCDQVCLTLGYDIENLQDPALRARYQGAVTLDHYGRAIPQHAHGSMNLPGMTSSTEALMAAFTAIFDRIADPLLLVRRITLVCAHVLPEEEALRPEPFEQLDLFTDYEALQARRQADDIRRRKEKSRQQAVLSIRKKYGNNAILRGMNLLEDATARDRNSQIGGHKA